MKKTDPYPHPSSTAVTKVMRGNRRSNTRPELLLRSILHRSGHRFRKDLPIAVGGVRARPDIVFTRHKVAVFVDGCFWHSCPQHGHVPRANTAYWAPKLSRNAARDRATNEALHNGGWTVVRIWEHEEPMEAITRIVTALGAEPARGGSL